MGKTLDVRKNKFILSKRGGDTDAVVPRIDKDINHRAPELNVQVLPAIKTMMDNTKVIIDAEMRRLIRECDNGGLRPEQTKQFEKYATSLCRILKADADMRDTNPLDAMSDTELKENVKIVLGKSMEKLLDNR
jgi:hypothetical protein